VGHRARRPGRRRRGIGLLTPASDALLAKLGKHSTGKACLYIKRLSDISEETLRALIKLAAK
jgi:DNA-binding MarR family transcriptional regulator